MKNILIVVLLALNACAQLKNGQIQPVVLKGNNLYFATCSGAAENMASCNTKAMGTCANGYNIIDKFQDTQGATRTLTFECK